MKKREIMRRAQQLRREGLSMSEALKRAHKELGAGAQSSTPVIVSTSTQTVIDDVGEEFLRRRFREVMEERLQQSFNFRVRYEEQIKSNEYEDGQMFLLSSPYCPACAEFKSKPYIKEGLESGKIILLEDEDDPLRKKIEKKLNIEFVPVMVSYSRVWGFELFTN